jgi:hypothetical protein
MKSFITKYFSCAVLTMAVVLSGCDKTLEENEKFQAVTPTDLDEDAGEWTMIVLNAPDQVVVPAPTDVTSDAYKAELATIKTAQQNLTAQQHEIIEYWSAGGVVRWNQFMRELVARFNLPPAPTATNTYPIPDAENPFADPIFPFSNPPYAARAYSYVSVGQFEALKAAWHYKYLYNRPAPAKVDNTIESLMPITDLPAYPSEDATLSGVSVEMLKALFPTAIEEITLKAAEQRSAALWSGKATASDISAGLALGKAVAALVLARASTDGMKQATGSKAIWDGYVADCNARGEAPWLSQDIPVRPPLLMSFGNVKAWNLTAEQIANERPVPPPSTSSEGMKADLEEVKHYSKNVTREQMALVHKWADGAGTYTPPGHWNDIATEFIHKAGYSEVRTARAYALLNMSLHDAAVGCWNTKYFYFNPRPIQLDPEATTCTGLPNFPSYTSGHSTFSSAAATVLSHMFPSESDYFNGLAGEASVSRLYGSIHYRADIEMGMSHGKALAGYTIDFAQSDGAD